MSQVAFLLSLTSITAVEAFKLMGVIAHLVYIYRMGPNYKSELDSLRLKFATSTLTATYRDICGALKNANGMKVGILGFKEYPIRARAEEDIASGDFLARIRGYLIKVAVKSYDFTVLGFFGGLHLIVAGILPTSGVMATLIKSLALASCLILALTVFAIGCEASMNYARLSSYGLAHHNPRMYVSRERVDNTLAEAGTLAGIVVAAVYIDTATLSYLSTSKIADFALPDLAGLGGLFNDFYHSFMTFIFSTQIVPVGVLAKLFVINVTVQGILVLIVGLTSYGSTSPEAGSK